MHHQRGKSGDGWGHRQPVRDMQCETPSQNGGGKVHGRYGLDYSYIGSLVIVG